MEKNVRNHVEIVLLLFVILKMEHVIVVKVHFGEKIVQNLAMQVVQFQAMEHVYKKMEVVFHVFKVIMEQIVYKNVRKIVWEALVTKIQENVIVQ
jgi:hypothetical protein